MNAVQEINFDGLIGPTHHFGGLAHGNLASEHHGGQRSHPLAAVLSGLNKMRMLVRAGVPQAYLPPHERPHLGFLRNLGFSGKDAEILAKAWAKAPRLLEAAGSASAMWTANAAWVTGAHESTDGRIHFTPANLSSHVHRSLEARQTTRVLRAVFHNQDYFRVHDPLPATLSDEGAANAMLLKPDFRCTGLSLLVYGRRLFETTDSRVTALNPGYAYPARQTYEACESIVRRHNIRPITALLMQQNTNAIQCGVFHNDVIATGHRHLLLAHEHAFQHPHAMEQIKDAYARQYDAPLYVRLVRDAELSLRASVDSYLFNSQIVSSGEDMLMLAPQECAETPAAHAIIQDILADEGNPLRECKFVDLRESMHNGGGPACLRLRVEMDECARSAMHGNLILENETQIDTLETWARKHYRDRLHPEDLRDPSLLEESRRALDELSNIMGLRSIYDFQRESTE